MKTLPQTICLALIGLLLFGYVIGDKGFAHVGFPPFYVSEAALAASFMLFMVSPKNDLWSCSRIIWIIFGLDLWCLFRTLPYIDEYGIDAPRDAAIFGYSLFSIIIVSSSASTRAIDLICQYFGRTIVFCIIAIPVILALQPLDQDFIDEDLPVILLKTGDVAVHLCGAIAFQLLGLGRMVLPLNGLFGQSIRYLFWIAALTSVIWVAAATRGGFLGMACGLTLISIFTRSHRYVLGLGVTMIIVLAMVATLDFRVDLGRREVSSAQIVENVVSIFDTDQSTEAGTDLASTIRWRVTWWRDILDYALAGPYWLTGKGFGINLADDDGYQTDWVEHRLRSPHNGHLTFLARAGVPGLLLWLTFLVCFAATLIRRAARMRALGLFVWQRLNLWVLAYWTAALVNSSFDVYLEGPQGGIWFWSITGFGLALLTLEQRFLTGVLDEADRLAFQPRPL